MDTVEKLLFLSGVSADFENYSGQRCEITKHDRLRALHAMGFDTDRPEEICKAINELETLPWKSWLKPFHITDEQRQLVKFHCHPQDLDEAFSWELTAENGSTSKGSFVAHDCEEIGEHWIGNCRYSLRQWPLPAQLPGYHRLSLRSGDSVEYSSIAVSPSRCFTGNFGTKKVWGFNCHLYSLRSNSNWGIGDFQDLYGLISHAAELGANMICLNPLHAPCSDSEKIASPYNPSDRRFLNPLYIAPERVLEFSNKHLSLGQDIFERAGKLRKLPLIDYEAVSSLKYTVYAELFRIFLQNHVAHKTPHWARFNEFLQLGGEPLRTFCVFESEHNNKATQYCSDWKFFAYLQWLVASQLAECQNRAIDSGMHVGLIGDLAVGSLAEGCEIQSNPGLFISSVTIGAPPDSFTTEGQDWELPVIHPVAQRKDHFRHFVSLIRANMRNVGGLRIDHVMSLMRLWWCLPESIERGRNGLYVYYALNELLALVRLESHRNQCLVIGEDLGVVDSQLRQSMEEAGIYGNTLFYFELDHDRQFKDPSAQRSNAALMVTNHDVSPLADWWQAGDIHRRFEFGLIPDESCLESETTGRSLEKAKLLDILGDNQLLPERWEKEEVDKAFDMDLCQAIHRLCARSNSQLLLIQLEDLQLMTEPVNIPGTYREYPHWRRKQTMTPSEIFTKPDIRNLLHTVNQERQRVFEEG